MKILIACHFFSPYTRDLIEEMYNRYGIVFDVLTMDKKYKKEIDTEMIRDVYYYENLKSLEKVINSMDHYDVIEIHFISTFYSAFASELRSKCNKLNLCVWGSDFYRTSNSEREKQKILIDQADLVIFGNPDTAYDFKNFFETKDDLLTINRFGLSVLNEIDFVNEKDKTAFRDMFGINENDLIITCGHNASVAQNHMSIINSIIQMPKDYLKRCHFIFPLTYGAEEEYIKSILKHLKKTGLKYTAITNYMSKNEIAVLRKVSTIFIQLQTSDQLSGSMQEHMYGGSIVITGSWLPYSILKNEGIFFIEIDQITELGSCLSNTIDNLAENQNLSNINRDIIYNTSSWHVITEQWYKLYQIDTTRDNPKEKLIYNISELIEANKLDAAKNLISNYINVIGLDAPINAVSGVVAMIEGDLEAAEVYFKKGLHQDSTNFDLYYNISFLYQNLNKNTLAYMYLYKSLEFVNGEELRAEIINELNLITQQNKTGLPLITIGVISYNSEKYIDECIKSIIKQDYPNYEIFIVDDASMDNTREKLAYYDAEYPNVEYIVHEKNTGCQSKAINEIIEHAKGDYLMILSYDDGLKTKSTLFDYLLALEENKELDFVYGDMTIIDEDSICYDNWNLKIKSPEDIIRKTVDYGSGSLPMGMGVFKRSFFSKLKDKYITPSLKDPKGNTGADTLNVLNYINNNLNYCKLDKSLMYYRVHSSNLSHSIESRIKSNYYVQKYAVENLNRSLVFHEENWNTVIEEDAYYYYLCASHFWYYVENYLSGELIPNYINFEYTPKQILSYCELFIRYALDSIQNSRIISSAYLSELNNLEERICMAIYSIDEKFLNSLSLDYHQISSLFQESIVLSNVDKLKIQDIEKAACISFYGRSGSVFLQSLLDSHPEILMLPGLYLMDYGRFWENLEGNFEKKYVLEKFYKKYEYLVDTKVRYDAPKGEPWVDLAYYCKYDEMGDNQQEIIEINESIFYKEMDRCLSPFKFISRKNLYKAVQIAYFYAIGREYKEKMPPLIIYPMHSALVLGSHHQWFLEDFTNAKILYTVRNPVYNLTSLIKYQKGFDLVNENTLITLFYHLGLLTGPQMLFEKFKLSNVGVVRLEDLHQDSEKTLKRICEFLDIKWNSVLLESTFNGLKWWNFRDTVSINGFSKSIINRSCDEFLDQFDVDRIESLLRDILESWEYSKTFKYNDSELIELIKRPFKFEKELLEEKKIAINRNDFENLISSYIDNRDGFKKFIRELKLLN
ncbi:glycosyltransferase [Fusibacter bizertensis]|uniref:Glycosyltransferase n=1 Tax=Fusibacter bizertensis TaxID=1488331 RepID=A0ABT6NDS9_9FIRM|nr:glycosyltransferase [Fusibacter bizertensis]MDH8678589.1 glycosyltransferase [Fusibacter bizertensis]